MKSILVLAILLSSSIGLASERIEFNHKNKAVISMTSYADGKIEVSINGDWYKMPTDENGELSVGHQRIYNDLQKVISGKATLKSLARSEESLGYAFEKFKIYGVTIAND